MLRLFDFECEEGHRSEALVADGVRSIQCPHCHRQAQRQISAPSIQLEGLTGAFPGAAMRWVTKRAEKQAVQERCKREHGTYT